MTGVGAARDPRSSAPPSDSFAPPSDSFVDAHVHFWDPGRFDYPWLATVPELDRPRLPQHLLADCGPAEPGRRPEGVVVVEADRVAAHAVGEAEWAAGCTSSELPVLGVVAHAPTEFGPGCAAPLDRLGALGAVVGIRRLLQDEGPGFASRPEFVAGVALVAQRGLAFDLCIRSHQLAEATELARRLPEVRFVLDHLGKPAVTRAAFPGWAADLERLAALPNVRCKLSGLATEADPDHRSAADLTPFLRHAIETFGPARCMFGSDWPVLTMAMAYRQWLDVVREVVDDLDADERHQVLRTTALTTYRAAEQP